MLNWALIKQPLNWVIVLLMVIIAAIAVDVILQGFNAPSVSQAV